MAKDYNGFTESQREKARRWLKEQQSFGRMKRAVEACDACGQTQGKLHYHSEDLSEPYGEHIGKYLFCYVCHIMLACRFRMPRRWHEYLEQLRVGAIWAPTYGESWQSFKLMYLGQRLPAPPAHGEPRPVLIFDSMGPNGEPLSTKPIKWPERPKPQAPVEMEFSLNDPRTTIRD